MLSKVSLLVLWSLMHIEFSVSCVVSPSLFLYTSKGSFVPLNSNSVSTSDYIWADL